MTRATLTPMLTVEAVAIFAVTWLAATFAIDAVGRRPQPKSLGERLWPYRAREVGDEAEEWLGGAVT